MVKQAPEIHLICGFIGFGKTTFAKQLEKEISAVRFTHDEIMRARYGRNPDNFQEKYNLVDEEIKAQAALEIKKGHSVIMDYGFWSKEKRRQYYEWARKLTPYVFFHAVLCDLTTAKQRVLNRTRQNRDELFIDEDVFNALLPQYEPLTENEGYPTIFHHSEKG